MREEHNNYINAIEWRIVDGIKEHTTKDGANMFLMEKSNNMIEVNGISMTIITDCEDYYSGNPDYEPWSMTGFACVKDYITGLYVMVHDSLTKMTSEPWTIDDGNDHQYQLMEEDAEVFTRALFKLLDNLNDYYGIADDQYESIDGTIVKGKMAVDLSLEDLIRKISEKGFKVTLTKE